MKQEKTRRKEKVETRDRPEEGNEDRKRKQG